MLRKEKSFIDTTVDDARGDVRLSAKESSILTKKPPLIHRHNLLPGRSLVRDRQMLRSCCVDPSFDRICDV